MDSGIPSTKEFDQESIENSMSEFERAFRELKAELYMKRNEANKLKAEVEEALHENNNLKHSLDKEKKISEESKINLEMFLKKTKEFQPKYYEKKDAFDKLEFQYNMETAKTNTLREKLQKMTMEKSQLVRENVGLADKVRGYSIYRNGITQKMGELRNTMPILENDIQKLKEDQQYVTILEESVAKAEENFRKCEEYSKEIEKLKLQNSDLEEKCIEYRAKAETLEEFISSNAPLLGENNLEAQVLMTQYKKASAYYNEVLQTEAKKISTLNEIFCKERDTNLKLLNENETKSKYIIEMETKLNQYEAQKCELEICDSSVVKIEMEENEIIVIDDSQKD